MPRSILQLVLIGFGIASIPLLAAFLFTASLVKDLSRSGGQGIVDAAEVVQESRLLVEHTDAIERHAQQFMVLDDPAVLEIYRDRREALHHATEALRSLSLSDPLKRLMTELEDREEKLFLLLTTSERNPRIADAAQGLFVDIDALTREITSESGRLIYSSVENLDRQANRVQRVLLWESAALVPTVLVLGGAVILMILRPLRSLSNAIERIGSGRFDQPVRINGPLDLQHLGERLESMRCRLIELENQKALFLRNMSHELKTPLTTLREGTQLLGEEVTGRLNHEQREIIDLLGKNTRQLQKMIEDLLQFNAIQSTLMPVTRQHFDLAVLVKEVIGQHRLPARAKQMLISPSLHPLAFEGDPVKLRAVVDNLLSNAIRYSPDNTQVDINLRKSGGYAVLEIRDQGPGIAQNDRERVFEAFSQGNANDTRWIKGSGLGLFIAREFVRMHKGTIHVMDSNEGAHLQVMLPLPPNGEPHPGSADDIHSVDHRPGPLRLQRVSLETKEPRDLGPLRLGT